MKKVYKGIFALIILGIIAAFAAGLFVYITFLTPNTTKNTYIYIPTGANIVTVKDSLKAKGVIKKMTTLERAFSIKKYYLSIKPGRYYITQGMNNNELVNMLRSGRQVPVKVTFNNIRTKEQLAGRISKYIEADSLEILNKLNDREFLKQFGFTPDNVMAMFIPNTYEFWWNTSAEGFVKRMYREYKKFWNKDRLEKAAKIGLTPEQVMTLASIVQAEQMQHPEERPIIAGLYINRLKRGIPLQSDPTLIYAWGDFSIKRVYDYHKKIDSPYNTYKYAGLPPAPIITPDVSSIDAVLNYKKHNYIYMCAKDDFSGYHYFTSSLSQHNYYARKYQQALNKLKIY